jgi:hypothetical protein
VKSERALRQQAEEAREEADTKLAALARAQTNTGTAHSTDGASHKGPKISVPDKFDGTHVIKAEVYANQIGLFVISNAHLFPNNRSKVIFSLSYLMGLASAWAQPFTVRLFAGEDGSYKEFSTAFQSMYFNTEKKEPGGGSTTGIETNKVDCPVHTCTSLWLGTPDTGQPIHARPEEGYPPRSRTCKDGLQHPCRSVSACPQD